MTFKSLLYSATAAALSFGTAHAATTTTLNSGGSSAAAPTYISMFEKYTASHATTLFSYEAVGSGGGQKAFLGNAISNFENVPAGTLTYGTIVGTQVDFAASDAPLVASQLTNPATGSYAESSLDGPLIQIPTLGDGIAMAFNESLQTTTLKLTDTQICGVLSGKITDWHSLNSKIPAGTTIEVGYRSDSSGNTFLLTQHLNAVCTSSNSNFPTLPVPITKYFFSTTASNNPVYLTTPPANFTGENGAANLAAFALATANSYIYITPDFTSIAPASSSTTSLKVASVVNASNNVAYTPTVANIETGLDNGGPGSTDTTPPANETAAMDPLNWVPLLPTTTKGYPIVGYTSLEISTCYANKTAGTDLINFLKAEATGPYVTIIKDNGEAPLANTSAAPFGTAVNNDFLSNTSGYNINIDNATTCASYAGR
jgi:ABC-type phosphate transport system substrate-binding protein